MPELRSERTARINRIARKLARHWKRLREARGGPTLGKKPLARRERQMRARRMIAYDFETTPIAEGNPQPLYLTAYAGEDFRVSVPIKDMNHLAMLLRVRFLIAEENRSRFVAWNGNGFDVYFIARALLSMPEFELRPYLTRSKNVRGLKVILKPEHVAAFVAHFPAKKRPKSVTWEFLDGMAMTVGSGLVNSMKLRDFAAVMAPDHMKLDAPDFDGGECFDAEKPEHVRYAERDSEALWHAMTRAEAIVSEHFGACLQPTIGNMAIKIFQANMPSRVQCWEPSLAISELIRSQVMRGGFCHLMKPYDGAVWKYDLNQAYAAAMRDAKLPAGRCAHLRKLSKYFTAAIYRVKARHPRGTLVPFYYVDAEGDAQFSEREITDTWLTNIEVDQLIAEGWILHVVEGYGWEETFSMREYVAKLEALRGSAVDGPSGALGTMVKSIGNNSYGKTVEALDGMELLMARERPEPDANDVEKNGKRASWHPYHADDEALENIWFRFREPGWREYHQPQLGAFITAHVRMLVRRAALLAPHEFLYADTDCVVFSRPVPLPVDPKKYGWWKCETAGAPYWLIAKKVYAQQAGDWGEKHPRHAKGMNVRRLTREHFKRWAEGLAPSQEQAQRSNFVAFCAGAPMFKRRERVGQRF